MPVRGETHPCGMSPMFPPECRRHLLPIPPILPLGFAHLQSGIGGRCMQPCSKGFSAAQGRTGMK